MDCDHEATLSEMEHRSVRHHTGHAGVFPTSLLATQRIYSHFCELNLWNAYCITERPFLLQLTKAAFVILKATSLNAVGSLAISLFFLFASCSLARSSCMASDCNDDDALPVYAMRVE
jgi:hypothetical protein